MLNIINGKKYKMLERSASQIQSPPPPLQIIGDIIFQGFGRQPWPAKRNPGVSSCLAKQGVFKGSP